MGEDLAMARPRRDGSDPSPKRKENLTETLVQRLQAGAGMFNVWDVKTQGLVLRVHSSGRRCFKFCYSIRGRPRWYHIGLVDLKEARRRAAKLRHQVEEGADPAAERQAERGSGTFADLHSRYVSEHAKLRNKSWRAAEALIKSHLLPRWGRLDAGAIGRSDVRRVFSEMSASTPALANLVLANASAVFSWAKRQEIIATNPCEGVDRNPAQSRERVLSDTEIALFWKALDSAPVLDAAALRAILLTGQRPGEVCHMLREHVVDGGWWTMPGKPDGAWPGTKNANNHRVWLARDVRRIIADLNVDAGAAGFVFGNKTTSDLATAMRCICADLGIPRATPHDLRRSHLTRVTGLGFGREAMDRIANHRKKSVATVYDRHNYGQQDQVIMEKVAAHIVALASGEQHGGNVIAI
jgi:integrase